ncbi:NB-ARC domain protein [Amycolatopsis sp. YIM 10]|nr:NB-ARC domain protein [Amycolatopsis sp. YIM 10]
MPGRLLLVIGSNWGARPPLPFLPDAARELYEVLLHPRPGQCAPALPDRSLLHDPSAADLDKAIEDAFEAASRQEATLIVAFTGHGVTSGDDYYLLAADSPELPDSRTAYLLGQRFKELFRRYPGIDGLVLLLDTCESGRAADAAGQEWIEVLRRGERRFELLTATGDGPAFGGCFSKSLTYLMEHGSLAATDRLGCADVREPVNELCHHQQTAHLAFTGATRGSGDPTLWLAHNAAVARRRVALDGTVFASTAATVLRHFQPTASLTQVRAELADGRSVGIAGAAGCGKTALLTALTRRTEQRRVHCAWLGTEPAHTTEQVATELARQLAGTVTGFAEAQAAFRTAGTDEWQRADAVERLLAGPLRTLGQRVLIVLDDVTAPPMRRVADGLAALPRVQLVVTARERAELPAGCAVVEVGAAEPDAVVRYAQNRGLSADVADELIRRSGGSWLTISLLADVAVREAAVEEPAGLAGFYASALDSVTDGTLFRQEELGPALAVLATARDGAKIPFTVFDGAVRRLGGPARPSRLRELLSRLTGIVTHGHAIDGTDQYGLVHAKFAEYLRARPAAKISLPQAHAALADAIEEAAPMTQHRPDDPVHGYAGRAEPEHLWQAGRHDEAFACLEARQSLINAENVRLWSDWEKRIRRELGATHPLTFRAGARHARAIGELGDATHALELLRELVDDARHTFGAEDLTTMEVEDHFGYWTSQTGDHPGARALFADLADRYTRQLGEDDPKTLMARHHLALTTAKAEQPEAALAIWDEVEARRERVLGEDHVDTLRTRLNILVWTEEIRHPPPERFSYRSLLTQMLDTFGEDHPETITVSYFEARSRLRQGVSDEARLSLQELLPRAERVLGPDSIWVREIRDRLGDPGPR